MFGLSFVATPDFLGLMSDANPKDQGEWRALLVLGRVSNLPTVWSNCVAGWWLGGGGDAWKLGLLCVGATCLYVGGMFLNDAFDVEFDEQHRRERPIPSGSIRLETVWKWSFAWMLAGLAAMASLGAPVLIFTLMLSAAIVVYDAVHKLITFSPWLMAICRFLLFLAAAAAGRDGVTGLAIWSAFALAAYIVGLSYIARRESAPGALRYWPMLFLAAPLVLASIVNAREYWLRSAWLSLILAAWVGWCLQFALVTSKRNLGRTVSGLLAGIALVDWLAICGGPAQFLILFPMLLLTALLAQRFVPAT